MTLSKFTETDFILCTDGALIDPSALGAIKKYDDEDFEDVAAGADFLPRLQLMSSNATLVKEGKWDKINSYASVQGDTLTDLGKDVDVLAITWRPTALRIADDGIVTSHDAKSDLFQSIKSDSDSGEDGNMAGPEFLLYIPQIKKFVTFFMSSKSAAREAPQLRARLVDPEGDIDGRATITSKTIKTTKYTWQAPLIRDCVSPLEGPSKGDFAKAIDKFQNTAKDEVKPAPEAGGRER